MKSPKQILEEIFSNAMRNLTGITDCDAMVTPCKDKSKGDYQVNGVFALAKQLNRNPRELAEEIAEETYKKRELDE